MYALSTQTARATPQMLIAAQAPSFFSLVYPNDSAIHVTDLCPRGKAKEWMLADRMTPLPAFEIPASREARIAQFKQGGFTGPTNWYARTELHSYAAENLDHG